MWLHDPEMEQHPDAVWKQDGQGGELPGGLVPTFQKPLDLCPHTLKVVQTRSCLLHTESRKTEEKM